MGRITDGLTFKDGLTFNVLRQANRERLPQFRNKKGELVHPNDPDGVNWALSKWMNAVAGEVGEAANVIKKIERGDYTLDESGREYLALELADIATYLDILANRAGIDLGKAIITKFNIVSFRVGADVVINDDGSGWYMPSKADHYP